MKTRTIRLIELGIWLVAGFLLVGVGFRFFFWGLLQLDGFKALLDTPEVDFLYACITIALSVVYVVVLCAARIYLTVIEKGDGDV